MFYANYNIHYTENIYCDSFINGYKLNQRGFHYLQYKLFSLKGDLSDFYKE
jgi:hypothetical protein